MPATSEQASHTPSLREKLCASLHALLVFIVGASLPPTQAWPRRGKPALPVPYLQAGLSTLRSLSRNMKVISSCTDVLGTELIKCPHREPASPACCLVPRAWCFSVQMPLARGFSELWYFETLGRDFSPIQIGLSGSLWVMSACLQM